MPSTYICRSCGLSNAEDAYTISAISVPHESDYSPTTARSAREAVNEGEAKLSGLGHAIERLRKHQKALRSTIAQYKAFLSPISRLPEDVLLLIFTTTVKATRESLWRIAATCRRWRSTALSCSSLWANIQLDLGSNGSLPGILLQCSRAETQLLRAGPQTPLTCTLHISNHDHIDRFWGDPESLSQLEDTVNRLLGDLYRCSKVVISGSGHDNWDIVRAHAPATPPRFHTLHTLKISHDHWFKSNLFADTPMLKHLALNRVHLGSTVHPQLQHVRFLELAHCRVTAIQLFQFLRTARELETLLLKPFRLSNRYHIDFKVPRGTAPVHLPSLRTLDVCFARGEAGDAGTVPTVLHHLRTPRLSSLTLGYFDNVELKFVESFIRASNCASSLEHLIFSHIWHQDDVTDLPRFLSRIPNVKSITIGPSGSHLKQRHSNHLLESLVWSIADESTSAAHRSRCPNLEYLAVHDIAVDPQILQRMVESRVLNEEHTQPQSPARLRTVKLRRVHFTGKLRELESPIEWLKALEARKLVNLI